MIKSVKITPIGKPRMTRADKWKKRKCVLKYRAFADELRLKIGKLPDNIVSVSWNVYFPLTESWSKKKKLEMAGKIHQQKPDRDNIDKAILDSLMKDDSVVSIGFTNKYWDDGKGTRIELLINEHENFKTISWSLFSGNCTFLSTFRDDVICSHLKNEIEKCQKEICPIWENL